MNRITATCRAVLNWLEHGDLVPLIILVSAWHYSVILSEHDHVIAAVSIGTLVDLGHYRWTKAAVRYPGDNWKEKYGRWAMVLIMSAIALNYQQRFYNDWWLSIPMPLLIASLAWLNQKDSKSQQKPAKSERQVANTEIEIAKAVEPVLTCEICGATTGKSGKPITTQAALNAHMKAHKAPQPGNGSGTGAVSERKGE